MAAAKPKPNTTKLVAIADLKGLPGNPRRGNVEAVASSLKENGQFRPIVVNARDMTVLAGNHTMQAAELLGWKRIRAFFVDVDQKGAKRIALADNRIAELGTYDDDALARMLRAVAKGADDLDEALAGTGYGAGDLDRLLASSGGEAALPPPPEGGYQPQFGVIVVCSDEADQQAVYAALQEQELGIELRVVTT